ncbi:MAG: ribosomal RNA small subunit methyltransferase A [Candidatus Terrybacteria bacterium]|nr:ribosomal RNA small subunit methyltransferase A [Candidatus Terrybacteria bacterium]
MKPIKFLGQNFLKSKKIVNEIIKAADLKPDDVILEVGPGKGILTEALLEKVPQGKVIAVEKDKRLVELLAQKFRHSKNLFLVYQDILKIDICKLIENCKLKIENYKVVANIPYYITSRFLRIFLQSNFQPTKMVLMIQKEVAERIMAKNKKESILSISVKAYGQPKIIKKVPARYFSPQPKVDSAILLIDNISKDFFRDIDEQKFFEIVKKGFSQKRKLLKNNLKMLDIGGLTRCGVGEKVRAEDLSLENWKCLAGLFTPLEVDYRR